MVMAIVMALAIASRAPNEIASIPGRKMISIPIKPKNKAIIRLFRTISPNIRNAPKVANSGAVKLKAVASANGINVIAVKPAAIPTTLNAALAV